MGRSNRPGLAGRYRLLGRLGRRQFWALGPRWCPWRGAEQQNDGSEPRSQPQPLPQGSQGQLLRTLGAQVPLLLLEELAQVSEVLGEGVLGPAPWLLPWPHPGSAAPWLPTLLPSCCGMWRSGSSGLGLGPGQPGRRGWRSEEVEAFLYTRNWTEIWRGHVKASLMAQRLGWDCPWGARGFPSQPARTVFLLHFPVYVFPLFKLSQASPSKPCAGLFSLRQPLPSLQPQDLAILPSSYTGCPGRLTKSPGPLEGTRA